MKTRNNQTRLRTKAHKQELEDLEILNARADFAHRLTQIGMPSGCIEKYALKFGDEVWCRYSPGIAEDLDKARVKQRKVR